MDVIHCIVEYPFKTFSGVIFIASKHSLHAFDLCARTFFLKQILHEWGPAECVLKGLFKGRVHNGTALSPSRHTRNAWPYLQACVGLDKYLFVMPLVCYVPHLMKYLRCVI